MSCCSIKPRDLRYLVAVLERSPGQSDGMGGRSWAWQEGPRARAKITFSTLRDKDTGATITAAGNATMHVRPFFPCPPGSRVRILGATPAEYTVIGADPVERGSLYKRVHLRRVENEEVAGG